MDIPRLILGFIVNSCMDYNFMTNNMMIVLCKHGILRNMRIIFNSV